MRERIRCSLTSSTKSYSGDLGGLKPDWSDGLRFVDHQGKQESEQESPVNRSMISPNHSTLI